MARFYHADLLYGDILAGRAYDARFDLYLRLGGRWGSTNYVW